MKRIIIMAVLMAAQIAHAMQNHPTKAMLPLLAIVNQILEDEDVQTFEHVDKKVKSARQSQCSHPDCVDRTPFASRCSLTSHMLSHKTTLEEQRPYLCRIEGCPKRFVQTAHRHRHERTHDDGVLYRVHCTHENCDDNNGKGFYEKATLRRHINATHNDIRVHCTQENCDDNNGKGFYGKATLNMHINAIHNDIRVHCTHENCDDSNGKGFYDKGTLNMHINATHNGIRFHCTHENCDDNNGKGFSDKPTLNRHINAAHNGIRFHCTHENCDDNNGNGFSDKRTLNRHINAAHNGIRFHCTHENCDDNNGNGF